MFGEKKENIFFLCSCEHASSSLRHHTTPGQHLLSRQHPPPKNAKPHTPTHPQNTLNRKGGDEFCALPAFRHAYFHIHVKDTYSPSLKPQRIMYQDMKTGLESYRCYLMNTSEDWSILLLHTPPSSSSPLSIFTFFNTAVQYLLTALRIHESPSLVPVVAPKRQFASLPPPSYLPVPPSACQCLSPFIPPFFLDWLSSRRSFSLPQYSVCLLPKLSHCQAHDIISLPFMGNSGLP